jgi:uncharacterized membrane protein YgdD (TMEM256/DUF423 family)
MMLDRIAAIWVAIAIAAGAFAAHGANGPGVEWLRTGALYAMVHGVAAIAIGKRAAGPAMLMLGGSMVFALTLFAMAAGAPRWLGAITPLGGLGMIAGWLWFAFYRTSSRNADTSSSETDLST